MLPVGGRHTAKFGSAKLPERVEDPRLLKGAGRYTDDVMPAGTLHGIVVRSPHARACLLSVSAEAARAMPGVVAVYLAPDLEKGGVRSSPCVVSCKNRDGTPPNPVLARDEVRHVGDSMAFVAAEMVAAARDGAKAVTVDYKALPSITDLRAATETGVPQVWAEAPGKVCFDWETGNKARTDELFARAAHVTQLEIKNNRYAEQVLACHAARESGWPANADVEPERGVSGRYARARSPHGGRARLERGGARPRAALARRRQHGRLPQQLRPHIPTLAGSKVLASVYDFQAIDLGVVGVFTNTVPMDAYRGVGRSESNYLVERLVDAAARELGRDSFEFRKRNMGAPEAMPYQSAVDELYGSGEFARVLDAALRRADHAGFAVRRKDAASRGRLHGLGVAYYLEATMGAPSEHAETRFADDGRVDVLVGTQSTGQGHETAYVQLTAEQLGVPPKRIRVRQGDSDLIPTGGGTGGARSLYSEGQAILATAATVVRKGRAAAAERLEAGEEDLEFRDGGFEVAGTDRRVGLLDLAADLRAWGGETLDSAEVAEVGTHTFPNGCHVAEVEVDPQTGATSIVRYVVCDDMGRTLNPTIVRGQVQGGVAQGVGQALLEEAVYDPTFGQLLTGSFMDYALPRAGDLPSIEVEFVEVPCTTNPLGVKGAGEAGAVGSPPAVMNALLDALAQKGVSRLDMPATPETVWRALAAAEAA